MSTLAGRRRADPSKFKHERPCLHCRGKFLRDLGDSQEYCSEACVRESFRPIEFVVSGYVAWLNSHATECDYCAGLLPEEGVIQILPSMNRWSQEILHYCEPLCRLADDSVKALDGRTILEPIPSEEWCR